MKQLDSQIVILKIESSLLKAKKWKLNITYEQARNEGMVATQSDSQTFRFIEQIIPYQYVEGTKKEKTAKDTKYRYQQGLVAIVFENNTDFKRCCKKVMINSFVYKRFVGTTGGVKKDTVLFVRSDVYDVLLEKADNGRDLKQEMVEAKFESYKALMCSNTIPVTSPKGVIVIKDNIVNFKEDVLFIDDSADGTPIVELRKDYNIELDASDGFGICLPSLMEDWSKDVKEEYNLGGACLRNSFIKGMCYPFDFIEFAEKRGTDYMVIDVWGDVQDVRKAQLILTESMLKLWSSYDSIEHYLSCCEKNGYTFGINKIVPNILRDTRELNYQFIQSYNLSDEDILELINPTIQQLKQALCGDYKSTIEFIGGTTSKPIGHNINCVDALLTSELMLNDPYVKRSVYGMIKNKIDGAKYGKIVCDGDFQIASGDPYALCESMFGLEVKGLLSSGEFYSSYWDEKDEDEVLLFRAPMTSHNNIRKGIIKHCDDARYWYRFMRNVIIFNVHDTTTVAENGEDWD